MRWQRSSEQTTNTNTIVTLMQSTTWFKQMKFTREDVSNWSIATFQQQRKRMSLYEFKLKWSFATYTTNRAEHFAKIYTDYLDELETKKSK